MILAIQNDRLNIFYKNHENVDRRYDVNAGKIRKVQSYFLKNNPKDEKEAAIHAFLFRGNFIRKFMRQLMRSSPDPDS